MTLNEINLTVTKLTVDRNARRAQKKREARRQGLA
jgi:hypothetical protein